MKIRFRGHLTLALMSACILVLSGCASDGSKSTMDDIQDALKQEPPKAATAGTTPPAAVTNALLPPIQLNIPGVNATAAQPRFDVKVRHVAARDFFLGLVEGTRYNMVVPPRLTGHISLDLKNMTVPEVMNVVRETYGYQFDRTGDTFQVVPNTLQTRIFHLNYLDIKRVGTSKITAGATEVSKSGNNSSNSSGSSGSTSTTSDASTISTQSISNFWQNLKTTLTQIIGSAKGRAVSVDPESGLVVIRAYPAELRQVQRYLTDTQQISDRQVVLEARVLEVDLSKGYQAGINWAQINNRGLLTTFGFANGTNNNNPGLSNFSGLAGSGGAATSYGGLFTVGAVFNNFSTFIDLLKTQGSVHVLSSPRVSTVNNQKAVIKVGSDEFFVTNINTTSTYSSTGAAGTTPTVQVEWTPFFSGVSLDVTPQISADGEVILHVHPSVSEVTEQTKNVTVTTNTPNTLSVPLARSDIRESDSIVRAENGQIIVIGGLIQNRTRKERAGIPVLGDIPGLGLLFSHVQEIKTKTELVILLKATVVKTSSQWADQLHQSSAVFHELGQEESP